jgi:RecB family endonuclease NucS
VAFAVMRGGVFVGVVQLSRYLERLELDPNLRPVRGVFVAQVVKPQARVLAESRGIAWVEVDYDELRGIESNELRLF